MGPASCTLLRPMAPGSPLPPETRRILDLARDDRSAARASLAALPLERQAALVCATPAARRAELLSLAPSPETLIPLLPEAELCFSVKGLGLEDAGWILEHATGTQVVACVDLDAWRGDLPDREGVYAWLEALADAGETAVLGAARALDPELLVLAVRERADVVLKPNEEGWEPPPGAQTLEGQFYLSARRPDDDLGPLLKLLGVLFREDYWRYFRLLQGTIWELDPELEVWARRWREGRLQDLGFPPPDEAVDIYAFLRPEDRGRLPEEARALDVAAWRLPIWTPTLPVAADARLPLFRVAGELDAEERRGFLYALVGLANRVAVADRRVLADPDSIPVALERAADLAGEGMLFLARENGVAAADVLRRSSLRHLFRVGANLRGELPAPT